MVANILLILSLSSEFALAQKAADSKLLTEKNLFTFGIEGPAVNASGDLYVVNLGKKGTIGRVTAGQTKPEVFTELPEGSIGNSIRFNREGRMYIADYKGHKVFVVEPGESKAKEFITLNAHQPNDLTISKDGAIYASDPDWKSKTGRILKISEPKKGEAPVSEVMTANRKFGTTNGIDLSVDEKTMYVAESNRNEIWSYRINGTKLEDEKLVFKFDKFEIDGIKVGANGNIFVARITGGTIAEVSPDGKLIREYKLLGKDPTNLTFGGVDGKTLYVTQRDGKFIETLRVDTTARDWKTDSGHAPAAPQKTMQ